MGEMFNDFLRFMHFFAFCYLHYKPLISEDGAFVYRRLISEMQHALERRLLFYKWRYEYLLNDDVVVAVVVVVVFAVVAVAVVIKKESNLKIEFPNNIGSLNPYF